MEMSVNREAIMEQLKKKKITQTAIAQELGCQVCTINTKMNGKFSFTVEEMAAILKMLDMKLVAVGDEVSAVNQDGEIFEIIKTGG